MANVHRLGLTNVVVSEPQIFEEKTTPPASASTASIGLLLFVSMTRTNLDGKKLSKMLPRLDRAGS